MTSLTGIGHRIFVPLEGKTRILLAEAPEGQSFAVLDANGTKGPAKFQLPNPDPDGDGTTVYSVYARALGKPGGGTRPARIFPFGLGRQAVLVSSLHLIQSFDKLLGVLPGDVHRGIR